MKKYILNLEYESGRVAFPTDNCDILDALTEFYSRLRSQDTFQDKGCLAPMIKSVSISPVWYESIYKGRNNE